ncbi:lipase, partial [Lactobacillus salivarius]|nr:lipase [Ligilactobacillus salivarius]
SNTKEKNDYLSEDDHFHPNLKGYKYMTNKLFDEMNRHKNTWLVK